MSNSISASKNIKVFWLTGLPGAGKTTIAKELVKLLKNEHLPVVHIDGDYVREILGNEFSHEIEDREKLAMIYAKLCQHISNSDVHVVCSTVSLFHKVHDWNRNNINGYIEVFIDVPAQTLADRNQKGLYSRAEQGDDVKLPGVNQEVMLPRNPDEIIKNSGETGPDEFAKKLFDKYIN